MNGRLYDPLTAQFLSPDNYVQLPDFTQNFNRYSYCLNNPLVYTDPEGEWIFTILAAIFCPALLPVAIGTDIGWMTGGMKSMEQGKVPRSNAEAPKGSAFGLTDILSGLFDFLPDKTVSNVYTIANTTPHNKRFMLLSCLEKLNSFNLP